MRRHPLPSIGSLGLVPPLQRYSEVLRLLPPNSPHSFPSLGDTIVASVVRPPPGPGRGAVDQSGVGRRYLRPPGSMNRHRISQFRRNPCDHCPDSADPGLPSMAKWSRVSCLERARASDSARGLSELDIGDHSTVFELAVYAIGRSVVTHPAVKTVPAAGPAQPDGIEIPAGVHLRGFKLRRSSSRASSHEVNRLFGQE